MESDGPLLTQMAECLRKVEEEAIKLGELSKGIPAVKKNLQPIMVFIDILKFHIPGDVEALEA
jgi:hypothetical protein